MQETADGAEKIDGVGGEFFFPRTVPQAVSLSVGDLLQPRRRLIIAQSSRRILNVRLQMINRVSVTRVALFGEFRQFREQERPRLFFRTGHDLFGEPVEKLFIAGQKPAVQERQMKFGVVLFDAFALLKRAPGGAYAETEIPQRAGKIGN